MKYTFLVNQKVFVEQFPRVDLAGTILFDVLRSFCAVKNRRMKKIIYNDEEFTWVNYDALIAEMPLLRIKSKSVITERIRALKEAKLVKTFLAPDRTLYVRLNEKAMALDFDFSAAGDAQEGVRLDGQGVRPAEQGVRPAEQHNHTTSNHTTTRNVADKPRPSDLRKKRYDDQSFMDVDAFIAWCRKSSQRHVQIIADFAEAKRPAFDTRGQWNAFMDRNVRAARRLSPFSDEQIESAAKRIHGADWMKRWTLETVEKMLVG